MHGYHYAHLRDQGHAITIWNHKATQFIPQTFKTVRIAKDITAIVGTRRPESTRRKRRRSRKKRRK